VKIVVASDTVVPMMTPMIVDSVVVASGISANADVAETINAVNAITGTARNKNFFLIIFFIFIFKSEGRPHFDLEIIFQIKSKITSSDAMKSKDPKRRKID
jgi:peroxiredoxin family protein